MPDWLPIVLLLLILCIAARILRKLSAIDEHNIAHLDRKVRHLENQLKGAIMSEAQNAVDAVVAQLDKAKAEISAQIAELESREPAVDLSALKAAAQSLDDVVVDVPVEEPPVEEPPVEAPAEPTE